MLQELAGIQERRWWPEDVSFADGAAMAGAKALAEAGITPAQIGLMINTSVSRAHLEPSTAVAVHHQLGLPTSCLNFDLANACLGFVNGMQLAATMIDAGQIDYALLVDGEGSRHTQEATLDRLAGPDATRRTTCGPVRHPDPRAPARRRWCSAGPTSTREGHRVVGGVSRAGTEHHDLCVGDLDLMRTDTQGAARGRSRAGPGDLGGRRRPSSTGPTSTATSPTRSRWCTSGPWPTALGIDPRRGSRSPSPATATWARPRCRSPWPRRPIAAARRSGAAARASAPGLNTSFAEIVW